ncbi:MAG TPA: glycosyltransferase [Thermoleophilaceae bacterium]|nr:glycosyltransferase [Thermoleophilaceae bacterium]
MAPSRTEKAPGILWIGPYEEATGLADEVRGFLRALEARGHAPAVRSNFKPRHNLALLPSDRQMVNLQRRREVSAPVIAIHHYITSKRQFDVKGVPNVARAMFETDSLPLGWRDLLITRDEIWVPCEHNAEAFRRGGIPSSRLRVLGETIDFDLFDPGIDPYPLDIEEDRFVFLSNFDFGERKGWRQLIAGWAEAFTADDGVCLVLKTGSYTHGEAYAAERITSYVRERFGAGAVQRMAPIEIVSARLPAAELPSVYAAADAYVLASRGEGWGRPYMEAMAMGLPTIGSRWSGNLDFMNDANSFLVDGELVPVAEDAEGYPTKLTKGHKWFEPDVDSLAARMREVAAGGEAVRARTDGTREELIERFGTDAIVDRILELASGLFDRLSRPYTCAIRGPLGSNASLAVVNDGIGSAIEGGGGNVLYRGVQTDPVVAEFPGVSHSWPPNFDAVTVGPMVVILPWEYGSPPKKWVNEVHLRADRVWVPSAYVREGYIEAGMPPGVVEVVPNGVDLERFNPDGPARELPSKAACTFLFVGGSIWRKGVDVLVDAWAEAFGPDDDVQLVIKDFGTTSHYRNQTAGEALAELADNDEVAPVIYMDEEMSLDELAALYRACDVFVTPYRGEGFCLPALEAMACGLPVIHTAVGPTNEFVPEDGGWRIPAERAPLRPETRLPELVDDGYVHEADPHALAEILREVAAAPEERRARGASAHVRAQDYHWERVAAIARQSLDTLVEEELPLARAIGAAELPRRDQLVVFAPDWDDEDVWAPALERWAAAIGSADPVTLALYVPDGSDAAALAERILGRLGAAGIGESELPDLALCEPESVSLASLVAAADAVLVPAGAVAGPALTRRARRILDAGHDDIESFAASMKTHSGDQELLLAAD